MNEWDSVNFQRGSRELCQDRGDFEEIKAMKYFESVKDNPELMVMLHGGGTSHLGMLATAKEMAHVYHVVIVA